MEKSNLCLHLIKLRPHNYIFNNGQYKLNITFHRIGDEINVLKSFLFMLNTNELQEIRLPDDLSLISFHLSPELQYPIEYEILIEITYLDNPLNDIIIQDNKNTFKTNKSFVITSNLNDIIIHDNWNQVIDLNNNYIADIYLQISLKNIKNQEILNVSEYNNYNHLNDPLSYSFMSLDASQDMANKLNINFSNIQTENHDRFNYYNEKTVPEPLEIDLINDSFHKRNENPLQCLSISYTNLNERFLIDTLHSTNEKDQIENTDNDFIYNDSEVKEMEYENKDKMIFNNENQNISNPIYINENELLPKDNNKNKIILSTQDHLIAKLDESIDKKNATKDEIYNNKPFLFDNINKCNKKEKDLDIYFKSKDDKNDKIENKYNLYVELKNKYNIDKVFPKYKITKNVLENTIELNISSNKEKEIKKIKRKVHVNQIQEIKSNFNKNKETKTNKNKKIIHSTFRDTCTSEQFKYIIDIYENEKKKMTESINNLKIKNNILLKDNMKKSILLSNRHEEFEQFKKLYENKSKLEKNEEDIVQDLNQKYVKVTSELKLEKLKSKELQEKLNDFTKLVEKSDVINKKRLTEINKIKAKNYILEKDINELKIKLDLKDIKLKELNNTIETKLDVLKSKLEKEYIKKIEKWKNNTKIQYKNMINLNDDKEKLFRIENTINNKIKINESTNKSINTLKNKITSLMNQIKIKDKERNHLLQIIKRIDNERYFENIYNNNNNNNMIKPIIKLKSYSIDKYKDKIYYDKRIHNKPKIIPKREIKKQMKWETYDDFLVNISEAFESIQNIEDLHDKEMKIQEKLILLKQNDIENKYPSIEAA